MRDDIHKRVPVSQAMRSVLRGCMRTADRQQPDVLRAKAIPALLKDLRANFDATIAAKLAVEASTPSLFGLEGVSAQPRSALQSEALSLLATKQAQTVSDALGGAVASHITSVVSETDACMVAAGVSRQERLDVINSLRSALTDAAGPAIASYLQGERPASTEKVKLDDFISLGPNASRGPG